MTQTHRATPTGPAHLTIGGRTVCGGSGAALAPGDAPPCRLCARTIERRRRATAA
jgi:hypothetical protein